ncbi:hypothetical protein NUV26_35090 [Burkholderia pseudomultivorans]|uniref:hypothetical protein n=1 Tax=Burkholderia pseudomultivorans TaxID=1207504 RepID=UPI0012DA0D7E|nr:hypothetical protein [Burkholderia pseudomultivorans]MDS0797391.1 hypothetical protein [Burkholderia pseudomultivorans]
MENELANGGELCDVIERISAIEWRKFQSRSVDIDFKRGGGVHEDRSTYPPYASFRFVTENNDLVIKIKSTVEGYKGAVEWVMTPHQRVSLPGRNWVIRPRFVEEVQAEIQGQAMNLDKYISKNYPGFSLIAYADMLGLVRHIENVFELK